MKPKILILGASSFAGSSFFDFLFRKNKFILLGTYNSKKNLNKLIFKKNLKKINLIKLDLSREKNSLIAIVKKFKPTYIFDFASICMVNESWDAPNNYLKINVNSKINFLKNLNKFNFLKKFIYVSTPEVFGSVNKPVRENSQTFNPSTPYAISKLAIEKYLIAYNEESGNKIIISRFSNFYGRGQLEHRLIPKVINCINKNKKFPLHGDGLTKRNFIFDDDFNEGFLKIMLKGKGGRTYHFSSNSYVTIKKIIQIICKYKNSDFNKVVYEAKERKGKDKFYFLDCKKTAKELKWKAKTNLSNGLLKTINYYDNEL